MIQWLLSSLLLPQDCDFFRTLKTPDMTLNHPWANKAICSLILFCIWSYQQWFYMMPIVVLQWLHKHLILSSSNCCCRTWACILQEAWGVSVIAWLTCMIIDWVYDHASLCFSVEEAFQLCMYEVVFLRWFYNHTSALSVEGPLIHMYEFVFLRWFYNPTTVLSVEGPSVPMYYELVFLREQRWLVLWLAVIFVSWFVCADLSCLFGRNTRSSVVLPSWWWLHWVSFWPNYNPLAICFWLLGWWWFRMFHQLTTQCILSCACRLSFALVAGKMKEKVRVVAMDARGHGLSSTEDDSDLSAQAWCLLPLSFVVRSGKFSELAKIWKRFLLVWRSWLWMKLLQFADAMPRCSQCDKSNVWAWNTCNHSCWPQVVPPPYSQQSVFVSFMCLLDEYSTKLLISDCRRGTWSNVLILVLFVSCLSEIKRMLHFSVFVFGFVKEGTFWKVWHWKWVLWPWMQYGGGYCGACGSQESTTHISRACCGWCSWGKMYLLKRNVFSTVDHL